MPTIETSHIIKTFGSTRAVDDVSFTVEPGEIFGLLGPNGAGKTTTIRTILDIFKPDSGVINIFGGPIDEAKKERIGYLPEERGLYQDVPLDRCLTYISSLKGLSHSDTQKRIDQYLERFELSAHRKKKVKELSKGMQQKAQLIVTLAHQPDLVVIDEPFSALDPVNTQMVKDLLREERASGKTIIMCTHQMHQVEELCDRLVLINHGKAVLYGKLDDIRHQFAGQEIKIRTLSECPTSISGVAEITPKNGSQLLRLEQGYTPQQILQELVNRQVILEQFEIAIPDLDEIFIRVVKEDRQDL